MTDASALRDFALDLGREAGALAQRRRAEGVEIAATKSALADIVTEADREVEALIRDRIARERPGDGFFGEESGAEESTTGITWVVDPIDGTVNYAYGIPAYAVSIGAVEGSADPAEWTALAGAVVSPATREEFHTALGHGAFLGDRRLAVNGEPGPAGALIATGFGYDPEWRLQQFAVLERVMPIARDLRRIGAASLDLAAVAAGRIDAYYERGLSPWDHAAGALLVQEAGGVVGGANGAAAGRDLLIAAVPGLFERLEAILVD